jgi:hypothetical protein
MKFSSMRSAIVIASVVAGSVIPSQAFAQFDVLTGVGVNGDTQDVRTGPVTSTYTFTSSMILNSVGFVTQTYSSASVLEYSLNGGAFTSVALNDLTVTNGFGWLNLTPVTMNQGQYVTIRTVGSNPLSATTPTRNFGSVASGSNIVFSNDNANHWTFGYTANNPDIWSNGNIRVSNPGSNVAPEPGTFALALTGGAALIGVCIRRRRNAA